MYYTTTVSNSPKLVGSTAIRGREYTWTLLSDYAHVLICLANDPLRHQLESHSTVGALLEAVARKKLR